jgi:hypothetical protein
MAYLSSNCFLSVVDIAFSFMPFRIHIPTSFLRIGKEISASTTSGRHDAISQGAQAIYLTTDALFHNRPLNFASVWEGEGGARQDAMPFSTDNKPV